MAMTAAEHFQEAEQLLTKAAAHPTDHQGGLAWAARAQAHLDAARLLFDVEASRVTPASSTGTAAYRSGLDTVAEKRRANN
jgi:hypothetical protein